MSPKNVMNEKRKSGELPFTIRQETDLEKWRAATFWTKEPETIAWIDSFNRGETLLDIGANIGLYSLYAGKRGIKVVAVEPHPENFMTLALNHRQHNRGLPVRTILGAVGKHDELGDFYYDSPYAGSSDGGLQHKKQGRQHVRIFTVDYLHKWYGPFDHIKIDVDGGEWDVLAGMNECLDTIKSCLIELTPGMKRGVEDKMWSHKLSSHNKFNLMTPHSRERRAEEGINVENVIFTSVVAESGTGA